MNAFAIICAAAVILYRTGQIKHLMHTAFVAGIQFARKEAAYE